MQAEEFQERELELAGWPVKVASYRLGAEWHARADNVSPGATLARRTGATREAAEQAALHRAEELLRRTHRREV
jgi:hypothetical protein